MDLLQMIGAAGGQSALREIARKVGIDNSQIGSLVASAAPAFVRSLQGQAQKPDGLLGLANALKTGNHQRYLNEPELLADDATRTDGNKILGHLFGSKDVSRKVAATVSADTGVGESLIKKSLPLIASLVMAAASKSSNTGASLVSPSNESNGGLADLLSSRTDDGLMGKVFDLFR